MSAPFILIDKGDVNLFESIKDLERYVESPDIAGYQVFGANGQVLHLTTIHPASTPKRWANVVSVDRVTVSESRVHEIAKLEILLRDFLFRSTGKLFDQSALPELLTILQATFGFTR